MEVFDKLFSYVDKSADLTQSMLDNYRNSLIVLGDQKQMYIPLLNSYIGLGMDAYNYIMDALENLILGAVDYQYTNENHEYNLNFLYNADAGPKTSYVNEKIKFNPYHEYLKVKTFVGNLNGNADTASQLKYSYHIWGNEFNGTQDVDGDIIPKDNHEQTIGDQTHYFAYAYIDSIIGALDGYASYSYYSGYAYTSGVSYYAQKLSQHYINNDHEYFFSLNYEANPGVAYSYVSDKMVINPYQEYLKIKNVIGHLEGNADTASKLKTSIELWGNTFDGSQDINGDIVPKDNHVQGIGKEDKYFAYAYIDSAYIGTTYGNLYGNAETASYSDTAYISYYSYTNLIQTKSSGLFPVTFANSNTGNRYFSYSYVTNTKNFVVPSGLTESDVIDVHNNEIIRFKGFKSGLYYFEDQNALYSTYFKGMLLGIASYTDALYTPRKINDTNFDGTEDITTTYWGYERNFNIADNSNTYIGPDEQVHGDKDITLKLPDTLVVDIIGNSSYATYSGLSENNYKQWVTPTNLNKDYYFEFTDKISNVFAYTYSGVNLKYNPAKNTIYASYFEGWNKGTSDKAAQLLFSYEINGTKFDGTKNITTTYWGYARNITVSDYHGTYTYLNSDIDGSSDFTLKLPQNIHANINGNADTATYSNSSDLSNRTYKLQNTHTNSNNAYMVTFIDNPNTFAYSYFNINLEYNPANEELTTTYFHATGLFRGQLRAADQWGTLGG